MDFILIILLCLIVPIIFIIAGLCLYLFHHKKAGRVSLLFGFTSAFVICGLIDFEKYNVGDLSVAYIYYTNILTLLIGGLSTLFFILSKIYDKKKLSNTDDTPSTLEEIFSEIK